MSQVPPPPPSSYEDANLEPAAATRPWQAAVLTALQAAGTVLLVIAAFAARNDVFVSSDGAIVEGGGVSAFLLVLAAVSLLLTIGLARRNNLAWALTVVGGGLSVLSFTIVNVLTGAGTLVLALMPTTRAWYRRRDRRSNLSVSKGFIAVISVVVLAFLAFAWYALSA
jgi:hypothetical protein